MHKETIIAKQLHVFSDHVVAFWPMKRKQKNACTDMVVCQCLINQPLPSEDN